MGNTENRIKPEDSPIHDWYRFVLSFPPHLVRDYLEKFNVDKKDFVLDPFCGTGTTNVECKKNGIRSWGIEANPLTHFVSQTKSNWNYNPDYIMEDSIKIAEIANHAISALDSFRCLSDEQAQLILKNSISDQPLSDSLVLRDIITSSSSLYKDLMLLALAKHIVYSYSNLKFGPEVGISRKKKENVDVIGIWLNEMHQIQTDLVAYQHMRNTPTHIFHGDARTINNPTMIKKVNYVITSPPYPNEKDYSRTTRLESVILGYVNNKNDLRQIKQSFIRSNSKNIYKNDSDAEYVKNIPVVNMISNEIEKKRLDLGKTSGFEKLYPSVVKHYFGGMARHFIELKPYLSRQAKLAYIVGDQASYFQIPIKTSLILCEIAESVGGYKVQSINAFRKRFATATESWLNEDVLVLKYVGE
ncbi:MAG: DNA methyltransferase [Clostridia bacterium]|nr:DNA methyltransferase [Clostridia bacterium]